MLLIFCKKNDISYQHFCVRLHLFFLFCRRNSIIIFYTFTLYEEMLSHRWFSAQGSCLHDRFLLIEKCSTSFPLLFMKCAKEFVPCSTKQGFRYFVRLRSGEIQVNLRYPVKFTKTRKILGNSVEILSNACLYSNFETCLSYWGYLLAVNLQIYVSKLCHWNVQTTFRNYKA